MSYLSHAWGYGHTSCQIFVRLHEGKRPSAGETLLVDCDDGEQVPLAVLEAHWQDEEPDGVLILGVGRDQRPTVDRLTAGARIRRQPV